MNNFGNKLKIKIWGGSHEPKIGIKIYGIPKDIEINEKDFETDLNRRKPGKKGTTTRIETDYPIIKSGIKNHITDGSPIKIEFINTNTRPIDYELFNKSPRPGHADFTARKKFGEQINLSGGGIFSGRMTVLLVAAGVIAKKIIPKIIFEARLISVNGSQNIEAEIDKAVDEGDSVGGIIECKISNVPIGLGEPFFDSIESKISHLVFAVPGIKGIEFGSGFKSTEMRGSEHNDLIINSNGQTSTNNSGGINGGISNGNDIIFRVAVKPTSSISKPQQTYNFETNKTETLKIEGRHDACIALRMPVIIESVAAIVIADFYLLEQSNN